MKGYRHEWKYICSLFEWKVIENRIKGMCELDEYAQQQGGVVQCKKLVF